MNDIRVGDAYKRKGDDRVLYRVVFVDSETVGIITSVMAVPYPEKRCNIESNYTLVSKFVKPNLMLTVAYKERLTAEAPRCYDCNTPGDFPERTMLTDVGRGRVKSVQRIRMCNGCYLQREEDMARFGSLNMTPALTPMGPQHSGYSSAVHVVGGWDRRARR